MPEYHGLLLHCAFSVLGKFPHVVGGATILPRLLNISTTATEQTSEKHYVC